MQNKKNNRNNIHNNQTIVMGCDTFEINLVLILSQVFQVTGISRVTNQEWDVKSYMSRGTHLSLDAKRDISRITS